MEVTLEHLGSVQFEIHAGNHSVISDQSVNDGGFDEGMTPPELLLASLGSEIVETLPFVEARTAPEACRSCTYLASCHGGCAGRRRLQNALREPDSYCPIVRGKTEKLEVRMAATRELPKGESACTTIVIARD